MEFDSGSFFEGTTSSSAGLVVSPLRVVPIIAISFGGEPLNIALSSCFIRRLVLQSKSKEEANPTQVTANNPIVGNPIDVSLTTQAQKVSEGLDELLQDVEDMAATEVGTDEDDGLIEASDDDQSC